MAYFAEFEKSSRIYNFSIYENKNSLRGALTDLIKEYVQSLLLLPDISRNRFGASGT